MSLPSLLLDFTSEGKCKWEGWFCSILRWFDCDHRRRSLWFWLIKERNILINEKQNILMRHCSFYQQMKMITGDIRFTDSGKIQPGELDIKDESTFTNRVVWLFSLEIIWYWINWYFPNWYFWLFSSLVHWVLYRYCEEKFCLGDSWELKG